MRILQISTLGTLYGCLFTYTKNYDTNVVAHTPKDSLKRESLDFCRKARVSRRAKVIDSCLLTEGKRASAYKFDIYANYT